MTSRKNQEPQKTEAKSRGEVGQISWQALKDGTLRLNIPKAHTLDKKRQAQKRLGLKNNPENRAIADLIKTRLNERIATKNYEPANLDTYLDEYKRIYTGGDLKQASPPKSLESVKSRTPNLDNLWERFCQYKKPLVKQTTFNVAFSIVSSHISKLKTKTVEVETADAIVAQLSQQVGSASALYRTLTYLSNCCDWAVDRGKLLKNPFRRILKDLKQPQTDADPDPFTWQGMYHVLEAYKKNPLYRHYAPFIEFRFKTGCRFGEGVGLKWKDIHLKENYIEFHATITSTSKGFVHQEGAKTESSRRFPIRPSLRRFLEEQKSANVDPESYVFCEPDGSHIRYKKFHYSWYGTKTSSTLKEGMRRVY